MKSLHINNSELVLASDALVLAFMFFRLSAALCVILKLHIRG